MNQDSRAKQPPQILDLRALPPCPKHAAAEDLGYAGMVCRIPRIDNALYHASSCNECMTLVVKGLGFRVSESMPIAATRDMKTWKLLAVRNARVVSGPEKSFYLEEI
jgi:hypothetical protein